MMEKIIFFMFKIQIINDKFRLVCTCELENIKNMSPAFINRFDVIVLKIN